MTFAKGTERVAGDGGDLLFIEQIFAELLGGEAGIRDGGEHIERAHGLVAGKAAARKPSTRMRLRMS